MVVFRYNNNKFYIDRIHYAEKTTIEKFQCTIINVGIGEDFLFYTGGIKFCDNITNRYKALSELLDFTNDHVYYDLHTIYHIVKQRNCKVSNHCMNYILNEFNNHIHLKADDLCSVFKLVKTMFYMDINKKIKNFDGKDWDDIVCRHYHMQGLVFKDGQFYTNKEKDETQILINRYQQYYLNTIDKIKMMTLPACFSNNIL